MAFSIQPTRIYTALAALLLAVPGLLHACGFESSIKGGFQVSHPDALDVAVAVAEARRRGLLHQADTGLVSDEQRLQQVLTDLEQLQQRLDAGRGLVPHDGLEAFSLVLVGPGLWSHYHLGPEAVTGHYHTAGPLAEGSVVLTHHSVLRALLQGTLSADQAAERGLIAFSGNNGNALKEVLRVSLGPHGGV